MAEASEYCCQHGMGLLSLETAEETDCINKWAKELSLVNGYTWTSGTDLNCKGKLAWCSTGEMFSREGYHIFMAPKERDDAEADQNCVSFLTSPQFGEKQFRHERCEIKRSFICESLGKYGRGFVGPSSPSHRTIFNATFF